ncbi:MAG: U32 family peptidase [Oscillospiraceae bacterium]|nr:U32 family peptidase [Oscillospiraceae bacterium]
MVDTTVTDNKIEVLAPAGNMEMLRAAVYSGANAVYMGLESFNARRGAQNFSPAQLMEAVAFCHGRGVKVNVTLNTTVYNDEQEQLLQAVQHICAAGVDAVLVQDFATLAIIKSTAPELCLHGSTQMAVHSLAGALQLKKLGFSRVVIARECSCAEIENITQNCGIETEVFVHGALCMSVSGQCYMSAFLGGRSGNRGKCAGPCRLPFSASQPGLYHLSLKDLSNIENVKLLQQMGVASVKIEGRLRTPEYVAAAVNACNCVLQDKPYDKELLQNVFSRNGFTNGYFNARIDGTMFGTRAAEDALLTKQALPKLRELFRREGQTVPVTMHFTLEEGGTKLTVSDGTFTVHKYGDEEPTPSENDFTAAVRRSLEKTGGTPFFAAQITADVEQGWYVPLSSVNELRRSALETLLEKRSALVPIPFTPVMPAQKPVATVKRTPLLHGRFYHLSQLPQELAACFEKIILPLDEAEKIPKALYEKTVLELPRALFANEKAVTEQVKRAKALGFTAFCAGNIAHFEILQGTEIYGGFSLNITNNLAANAYADMLHTSWITLSPEMPVAHLNGIFAAAKIGILGYGHLPLMMTRACPVQNVKTCAECRREGTLTDRKNRSFPLRCKDGVREIFNPVPLYMAERAAEINADFVTLYFTVETQQSIADTIKKYVAGQPFGAEFTRGLYYKGAE